MHLGWVCSSEQPWVGTSYLSREMEKQVTKCIRESITTAVGRYTKVSVPFPIPLLSSRSARYKAIQRSQVTDRSRLTPKGLSWGRLTQGSNSEGA